jgi:hypothetical protein
MIDARLESETVDWFPWSDWVKGPLTSQYSRSSKDAR